MIVKVTPATITIATVTLWNIDSDQEANYQKLRINLRT